MHSKTSELLKRLESVAEKCGGWMASCPHHDDLHPSLKIDEGDDRLLIFCHKGCTAEEIVKAVGLELEDLFFAPSGARTRRPSDVLTIGDLAAAKGLSPGFLTSVGVVQGSSGVIIRYFDGEHRLAERHRVRYALGAKKGSAWTRGPKGTIRVYGEWRLDEFRAALDPYLIVVEGESDTWTAWAANQPALGVPGASMVGTTLKAAHLSGFNRIFCVRENDKGGETFVRNVRDVVDRWREAGEHIGELHIVQVPAEFKDINDVYQGDPERFTETLQRLLRESHRDAHHGEAEVEQEERASAASIGRAIIQEGRAAAVGAEVFVFTDGVYRSSTTGVFDRLVIDTLEGQGQEKLWSARLCNDTRKYVIAKAPQLWPLPPDSIVNVRNGLLDLVTGELRPHSASHLSHLRVDVDYDPDATCPRWESFAAEVLPRHATERLWEVVGSLITPNPWIQVAVLFHGMAGSGKSVTLNAIQRFIGPENVANVALRDLEGNRFAAERLVGKLANICGELPSGRMLDSDLFKRLTGGDRLTVERKCVTSYEAESMRGCLWPETRCLSVKTALMPMPNAG